MDFLRDKISVKKSLFYLIPFIPMIILIIIGASNDFEIAKSVAVLNNGKYFSDSFFARFFEQLGQTPVYIAAGIAVAFLLRGLSYVKNKKLKTFFAVIFIALILLAYTLMTKRNIRYHTEMHDTYDWYKSNSALVWLISLGISLVPTFVTIFFINRIKEKYIMPLAFFALVIIFAVAFSQLAAQGIKLIGARLRYRAYYVLSEAGYTDQAAFYPLFSFAPSRTLTPEMVSLNLTTDIFKSFPSGHTCAGAMLLGIGFIPAILDFKGKKKTILTIVFWSVSALFVIILAYARMVAGAHYLTDVTFGAMFGYLGYIIGYPLVKHVACKFFYKAN